MQDFIRQSLLEGTVHAKEFIRQKESMCKGPVAGEIWLVLPLFETRMKRERGHMTSEEV